MAFGRVSAVAQDLTGENLLTHLLPVFFQFLSQGRVASSKDLDGEQSCVDGPCLTDAHTGNRDSLGHLHGGE